tara:strand:- start:282 stop:515 length:234 start_codon:yes stop_codon:yes gene_type:complete
MLGLRPWPFSIGPQVKLGPLTFSAEWATDQGISQDLEVILTAGIRLKLNPKRKNKLEFLFVILIKFSNINQTCDKLT